MTLIISEIGINFNGNISLAKEMIKQSKDCGADIAKFQLYDPKKLLDKDLFSIEDWDLILASQLSFVQTKELKQFCDDIGIEFMASAFDTKRLSWLEKLNVKRHKIASRSIYDIDYCESVFSCNKEVFISTGYLKESENKNNETLSDIFYRLFGSHRNSKILYCEAKYPTKLEELTFWENMFEVIDGFSDHTIGITASTMAIAMGASIIEKHFTLDHNLKGVDQICSITPSELKIICEFRDNYKKIKIHNSLEDINC